MAHTAARAPDGGQRLPVAVWLVCGAVGVLLVGVSARYGFHRDELYFVVAGRQLDWGYVDQPPLAPLLARLADMLPGPITPTVLRILPAAAAVAASLIAAVLARRFGGGRLAMAFAAAAVGGMGVMLAAAHLFSTATFEILAGSLLVLATARLLDGADPREWLWAGLVAGLAALNKFTVVGLAAALVAGILFSPGRRVLASGWAWAGGAVAAALASGTLLWQAAHSWPQWEMAAAIRADNDGPAAFLVLQIVGLSLLLAVPAVAGAVLLWRRHGGRWRAFPVALLSATVGYAVVGGSFYYTAPLYVPLLAAGGCWLADLRPRPRVALAAACGVAIGATALIALPILPPERLGAVNEVNGELGETLGWPELVDQVAAAAAALPPRQRQGAVVVTGNYGEASALLVLGEGRDLPPIASGHNNYWLWGPPAHEPGAPVIAVGGAVAQLSGHCPDMVEVGRIGNAAGVANEEQDQPIALCPGTTEPLESLWPSLRHYD